MLRSFCSTVCSIAFFSTIHNRFRECLAWIEKKRHNAITYKLISFPKEYRQEQGKAGHELAVESPNFPRFFSGLSIR